MAEMKSRDFNQASKRYFAWAIGSILLPLTPMTVLMIDTVNNYRPQWRVITGTLIACAIVFVFCVRKVSRYMDEVGEHYARDLDRRIR